MENEKKEVEETEELEEDFEDEGDDTTDWKAEAMKARGLAKRYKTKLAKSKEAPEPSREPVPKTKEDKKAFDYAEKAYLKASGIQSDEYEFVLEVIQATGKTLDEVLDAKYFQADLKERREAKASKDAIPRGGKRSEAGARDDIAYWSNKPFSEVPRELKREVLKAREKREADLNKFTDTPVG